MRDTAGTGDAEYWKQQWDQYEDDNAVVDVDVRGWLYTPHKGPLSRKNRIFVGLARQMVGIPAPTGKSPSTSTVHSRDSSPHGFREKVQVRAARHEDEIVAKEAETILKRGEAETEAAGQGMYSEGPTKRASIYSEREDSPSRGRQASQDSLSLKSTPSYLRDEYDDPRITPIQKRASWNPPGQMSAAQLAVANTNLMTRLQPFLNNPQAHVPISAFFYNESVSRQRTFETNAYGHFNLRAALDFVPTHVRILASESLSVTEEVIITESNGVSVISDIDDTIKHSAISGGAREIFRNIFIRDLGDLGIEGVKEWYQKLADMDVMFHYVSNSPWQLYPVLTGFFSMSGLPPGSMHLKAYTGMFQGIFEPVAERKKGTLERLMRDFPERKYLLVGDSGEADLEVYTDVVLEYPGRVIGVFIRDVTTPIGNGFFDSAMGPLSGDKGRRLNNQSYSSSKTSSDDEESEFKAAIAASLKELENSRVAENFAKYDMDEKRPELPRRKTEPPPEEEDLIDLNWEDDKHSSTKANVNMPGTRSASLQKPPPRPSKPDSLSGRALTRTATSPTLLKERPPLPRKPSSSVAVNKNHAKDETSSSRIGDPPGTERSAPKKPPRPTPGPHAHSYRDSARQKLSSAYNHLPSSLSSNSNPSSHQSMKSVDIKKLAASETTSSQSTNKNQSTPNQPDAASKITSSSESASPPLPARKPLSSYPAAAAQYASSLYNSATTSTASTSNNQNTSHSTGSAFTTGNNIPASKKEELWKRRWARAKAIMEEKGVMLRSWRVGDDVVADAVKLVEQANKEQEGTARRGGVSGKRTSVT